MWGHHILGVLIWFMSDNAKKISLTGLSKSSHMYLFFLIFMFVIIVVDECLEFILKNEIKKKGNLISI